MCACGCVRLEYVVLVVLVSWRDEENEIYVEAAEGLKRKKRGIFGIGDERCCRFSLMVCMTDKRIFLASLAPNSMMIIGSMQKSFGAS